ncbi:dipeptidase 1-like [Hydractinia symbiolongicarpus]|uniref:dipeptidase 1-like n=1 Tax=Hydractinia symbiolongicarpus TaxID=13093 RepID=UPI00254FB717|nr:dipeptidase 1-like [Hydractinia symbiolongicarpus]
MEGTEQLVVETTDNPKTKPQSSLKRKLLITAIILIIIIIIVVIIIVAVKSKDSDDKNETNSRSKRALAVLDEYPLIDGHNDLPWQLRINYRNQLSKVNLNDKYIKGYDNKRRMHNLHTSIPLLKEGKVGGQFWAAYMSCKTRENDAIRNVLEQIDVIKRFSKHYNDTFEFVTTADGILQAHKDKKIASLIGVESGMAIDSSLAVLRMLYELGARYMTITHSCNEPWADNWKVDNVNSTDPARSNGLSAFGREVILEMNRLGMLVDLSHVSHQTMKVALQITRAPVIFSHSGVYAVCNHNRNVRDDILHEVKKNGGVVMVVFYNAYVNCEPNKTNTTTVESVLRHINYIKNLIGSEYVGIGSDYDGVPDVPEGLENVSKYPNIFMKLAEQGWSDTELKNLAGANLIRVFKKAEEISKQLASEKPKETLMKVEEFFNVNGTCRKDWLEGRNASLLGGK